MVKNNSRGKSPSELRQERLAVELRANLRKRKAPRSGLDVGNENESAESSADGESSAHKPATGD